MRWLGAVQSPIYECPWLRQCRVVGLQPKSTGRAGRTPTCPSKFGEVLGALPLAVTPFAVSFRRRSDPVAWLWRSNCWAGGRPLYPFRLALAHSTLGSAAPPHFSQR